MAYIPPWYLCTDDEVEALAAVDVYEPGLPYDVDPADPRLVQRPTIFLARGAEPVLAPLREDLEDEDAPGAPYTPPPLPERGWTDARQRQFLAAIAEGYTVETACRAVGLSVQSAYKLRQCARGAAFALGWNGAILLQRDKLADALVSRVFDGQEVVVERPDGSKTVRHFYDNRLAQATLTRLDRLAGEQAAAGADHAARMVAQDFEAYLDVLASEAPAARAALFVARRTAPALVEDAQPAPVSAALAPIAALARADLYARTGVSHPDEIDIRDLDYAGRMAWTAEQWQRADAAGLLAPSSAPLASSDVCPEPGRGGETSLRTQQEAVTGSATLRDVARTEGEETTNGNPQPCKPRRPTTGLRGRIWRDEEDDLALTNFPPPPDFVGYQLHHWGHPEYERQLNDDEEIALEEGLAACAEEESAGDADQRDRWFRLLRDGDWSVLQPAPGPEPAAPVAPADAVAAIPSVEPRGNAETLLFVEASSETERLAMARDPGFVEENSEQADDGQAQDVAEEALARRRGLLNGAGHDPTIETSHGGRSNRAGIIPQDVPDLIDTMNHMITSGRIDNGAFAGEPMMDDEEDQLGVTDRDVEDDDLGISLAMQERLGEDGGR